MWVNSSAIICTFKTQMNRQIVDPGLTYNAAISIGDQHFEWKNIYIAAVLT